MPKLSMTMEEGEIVKWHKEEGEQVEAEEVLLEVMSDKANLEVEAPGSGVLLKKLYTEEDTVPVTELIGVIGEEGEDISDILAQAEEEPVEKEEPKEQKMEEPKVEEASTEEQEPKGVVEKVKASPAARRVAGEENIDLSNVSGTGPGGRVIEADAKEYVTQQKQHKATPTAEKVADQKEVAVEEIAEEKEGRIYKQDVLDYAAEQEQGKEEALTGLKKAAAERVSTSWSEVPHVTLNSEVDMSEALAMLDKFNQKVGEEAKISATDLILKALANKLREYPIMNAHLEEDKIVYNEQVNIGLAVDVEGDLVVPVLKEVGQKGVKQLNQDKVKLVKKARANKLSQEDVTGSNLTVSNLGPYEIDDFTPIINAPASSILGVGQIKKKPVVVDDEFEARPLMKLSLSFDHRLVNGAPAAEFLQAVKHVLEDPELLIL